MNEERLTLSVVNDLAELSRVAESIEAFCDTHAIPQSLAFKLNLALEELLTNTISYGFADAEPHDIAVVIARDGDELVAEIDDDARPFDPLQAPPPDLDSSLEDRRIGGLGVYLVKTMMDKVDYAYHDGRNHVRLRKRITSDPS